MINNWQLKKKNGVISSSLVTRRLYFKKNGHFSRPAQTDPYALIGLPPRLLSYLRHQLRATHVRAGLPQLQRDQHQHRHWHHHNNKVLIVHLVSGFMLWLLSQLMLFVLGEITLDAQAVADQGDSVWVRQPGDICWFFDSFGRFCYLCCILELRSFNSNIKES